MASRLLPVILFLAFTKNTLSYQQVLTALPGAPGLGQTVVSTIPGQSIYTTQGAIQPSILQLLRQPQYTQVLGGQPGLSQIQLVNGIPVLTTASGLNGLTASSISGSLPYPYTTAGVGGLGGLAGLSEVTTTNVNGIPVVLSGASGVSGVNYVQNGLQTLTVPSASLVQQPLVSVSPVVRQVPEEEKVVAPVVELDPMDAALLDMENKGQMHMEKYAWGRSAIDNKEKATGQEEAARERKADLVYLTPAPTTTGLVSPVVTSNDRLISTPIRTRNPFISDGGKRRKHFEHYEYFRNLDMTPHQFLMPMTMVAPVPISPSSGPLSPTA